MTIIYQLTLGSHLQADSFEAFAEQRYLPALHTGATRSGQWRPLRLLRRSRERDSDPIDLDRQFLLLVDWSGVPHMQLPPVDDPVVQGLFETFAPNIVRLGCFSTVEALVNDQGLSRSPINASGGSFE